MGAFFQKVRPRSNAQGVASASLGSLPDKASSAALSPRGPVPRRNMWLRERRFPRSRLGLPIGTLLLLGLFPSACPFRGHISRLRPFQSSPTQLTHPVDATGPERKKEATQEGATSHREQAPPNQGPQAVSVRRLSRGWRLI